jgi:hypothetical protein
MRIVNMQRINDGNGNLTKAIFDIDFGVMVIPDFKLMSDKKGGLWAVVPRDRSGREGAIRVKDAEFLDVITHAAREVYAGKGKQSINYELKRTR